MPALAPRAAAAEPSAGDPLAARAVMPYLRPASATDPGIPSPYRWGIQGSLDSDTEDDPQEYPHRVPRRPLLADLTTAPFPPGPGNPGPGERG